MIPVEELGRLAILQKDPVRYIQRRVEALHLVDDYHYRVTVTQQVLIPHHGKPPSDPDSIPAEIDLLVPLGHFVKDRLPDLVVEAPNRELLPVLSREEKSELAAALFTGEWARYFFTGIPSSDEQIAEQAWRAIQMLVGRAVAGSAAEAKVMLKSLASFLTILEHGGQTIPASVSKAARKWRERTDIAQALDGLSKTRLLVAKMRGVPGRTYALQLTYTERFEYDSFPAKWHRRVIPTALAWLGMFTRSITRDVANVGQAASLWIVQSMPEGVEALRFFWASDRRRRSSGEPVSIEVDQAVASHHPTSLAVRSNPGLRLEVQLAPSPALGALIGLAALLVVVSTYLYEASVGSFHSVHSVEGPALVSFVQSGPSGNDRASLLGLVSVFAAIPAAIAGALAYKGQTFTRRISKGPRLLATVLCIMAAFFAVMVSLPSLDDWAEVAAYIVSIYCFWLVGIVTFIQFGPRWRKSERTRIKKKTKKTTPAECRRRQFRDAVAALLVWTVITILFARCQAALQETHWFTDEFPVNALRAIWTWFGI